MRRNQFAIALSIAAASGLACVALIQGVDRAPRPRSAAGPAAEPAAPEIRTGFARHPQPEPVLASTGNVPRAATLPAVAEGALARDSLPDSLDAVPMTPWREAQLARYSPQERSMLDYKLGMMARMRECAAGIDTQGKLNVFLHYETQPGTGVAKGSGVDPIDSSLDRDADEAALDCVRQAHVSAPMPLLEASPEQREFHWATEIIFPLEEDRAYQFFAR